MLFSAVFIAWLFRRPEFREAETQERDVRASALDWTIVRAGTLFEGPRGHSYRLTLGDAGLPADPLISYADGHASPKTLLADRAPFNHPA
jgi:hypothetical protein